MNFMKDMKDSLKDKASGMGKPKAAQGFHGVQDGQAFQNGVEMGSWGVTLNQIIDLQNQIEKDWPSGKYSLTFTVNDVVDKYVKPMTKGKGVGYALLKNQKKTVKISVLVEISWVARFAQLVQTLKELNLDGEEGLWVRPLSWDLFQMWSKDHQPADDWAIDFCSKKDENLHLIETVPTIKQIVFVHTEGQTEIQSLGFLYTYCAAMQTGKSIRNGGLPRVMREAMAMVNSEASQCRDPKTNRDLKRNIVQQFGSFSSFDAAVKRTIQDELELVYNRMHQVVRGQQYGPTFWGMEAEQLKQLWSELQRRPDYNKPRTWTMRDVVDKVVKPQTQGQGLGLALLLNQNSPKQAKTLISHAWDETFDEFCTVVCQREHRGPIWICAFALYQCGANPSIMDQLGPDVKEGPFSLVLQQAEEMLVVHTAACDIYSRLWCVFEFYEAIALKVPKIMAGDAKVIQKQLASKVSTRTATCGPPSQTMSDDTRSIRGIIEVSMSFQTLDDAIATGRKKAMQAGWS